MADKQDTSVVAAQAAASPYATGGGGVTFERRAAGSGRTGGLLVLTVQEAGLMGQDHQLDAVTQCSVRSSLDT